MSTSPHSIVSQQVVIFERILEGGDRVELKPRSSGKSITVELGKTKESYRVFCTAREIVTHGARRKIWIELDL